MLEQRTGAAHEVPQAEAALRLARAVWAALLVFAPSIWLVELWFIRARTPETHLLELGALSLSSALAVAAATLLKTRDRWARGLSGLALTLTMAGLARRVPDAPGVGFVALAATALLAFGLLSLRHVRALGLSRGYARTGAAWSTSVLTATITAVGLAALAYASELSPPHLVRPAVVAVLSAAAFVVTRAEWDGVAARTRSELGFRLALGLTVAFAVFGLFHATGLLLLGVRLSIAAAWAFEARQLPSELVALTRRNFAPLTFASFGLAALGGGLLLAMPISSTIPGGLTLVDALFTAMSAVCVTGLTVVDTGSVLSPFGQLVVLVLIQVGGLGVMTLSAMITLAVGRSLTSHTEVAIGGTFGSSDTPGAVNRLIRGIATGTLAIEAVGALLLFLLVRDRHEHLADAAWFSVFHAVSAFNNAGFGLHATNLVPYASSPAVLHVIGLLIIFGGTGYGVINGLARLGIPTLRRAPRPSIPLHTKLVVATSAVLLVAGFVGVLALEWNGALAPLGVWDKLHNAWFQSVTLRTAGFNSVDFGALTKATMLLMMVQMFIGASPGSTGGGIKTVTAAVLFLSVRTIFSAREEAEAFGRRIDAPIVHRAMAVTILSLGIVTAGAMLLLFTQQTIAFEALVFEAVSAFATVGLTIGATPALDDPGKLIVMALMLIGRVGPLTAVAALELGKTPAHRFPREEVIVG
ncbi:hypothetical protein L6R52_06065 [Myxococcota bacterium]|nr:hypothetical protein [Myxococcota bacterium]